MISRSCVFQALSESTVLRGMDGWDGFGMGGGMALVFNVGWLFESVGWVGWLLWDGWDGFWEIELEITPLPGN